MSVHSRASVAILAATVVVSASLLPACPSAALDCERMYAFSKSAPPIGKGQDEIGQWVQKQLGVQLESDPLNGQNILNTLYWQSKEFSFEALGKGNVFTLFRRFRGQVPSLHDVVTCYGTPDAYQAVDLGRGDIDNVVSLTVIYASQGLTFLGHYPHGTIVNEKTELNLGMTLTISGTANSLAAAQIPPLSTKPKLWPRNLSEIVFSGQ